jgi:uncharacterized protein YndB with AHSA1/START domain
MVRSWPMSRHQWRTRSQSWWSLPLRVLAEGCGEVEVTGEYQTIDHPNRIAFTWRWQGNPEFNPSDSVVQIDFHTHAKGTLLQLRQIGIENDESRANHGHGWNGAFDKLERIFSEHHNLNT